MEPFANNDYEAIDRFIFDKLDSISDEATDREGGDTPIILICSDRRAKGEKLLVKLFSIGVYSALLGQDRSIDEVCKLIRKPRSKKEAKIYYKIESEDAKYQEENENTVSEAEIQNIRAHYKKLGKNEEAYVESFNSIATQYTDAQLKVIVKFLPLNVKAVLETKSPKYQSIMSFSGGIINKTVREEKKEDAIKIDFIENQLNKPKLTKPVIVPSVVNAKRATKLSKQEARQNVETKPNDIVKPEKQISLQDFLDEELDENNSKEEQLETQLQNLDVEIQKTEEKIEEKPKRGRGRPKKVVTEDENKVAQPKRGRGRPRKVEVIETQEQEEQSSINLFALDEEIQEENTLPGLEEDINEIEQEEAILPEFESVEEEQVEEKIQPRVNNQEQFYSNDTTKLDYDNYQYNKENYKDNYEESTNVSTGKILKQNQNQNENIANFLTKDKKIVSFVGTTKNGNSFLVNNLGELFSSMGINTAILDTTKNKNSYYIYTKNEEALRKVALNCMNGLASGEAKGIQVNNNLTVYTSLPTETQNYNTSEILKTLVKNHSLVLIDCDFDTSTMYFENSQEIYLVQSMDILTIQPLTAFLRDLKSKNIVLPEKIRVVINKQARIRGLNPKVIIGGMAYYNDPSMSFMTELFNKDNVRNCIIPFDEQVYSKYLEGLVNCRISLNGYSKRFMNALKELGNMVYPLLGRKYRPVENYDKKGGFAT